MPDKVLHSWTIPEYEKPERGFWWYVIATPIAIALVLWSIFSQNFLFAVILVMAAVILIRQTAKQPKRLDVRVKETCIEIGDAVYGYTDMRSFWILYEPPQLKTLSFSFRTAVRPSITIPLEKENPVALRKTLKQFVTEDLEREGEPVTEALGRILKI